MARQKLWGRLGRIADLVQLSSLGPEEFWKWVRLAILGGLTGLIAYVVSYVSRFDPLTIFLICALGVGLIVWTAVGTSILWRRWPRRRLLLFRARSSPSGIAAPLEFYETWSGMIEARGGRDV